MADKVVSLEFNVKTAGAVTEINKVTKATEGATSATIDYEKQLNDIKKATDGGGFKDFWGIGCGNWVATRYFCCAGSGSGTS